MAWTLRFLAGVTYGRSTHSAPWFLTLFTARLGNKTGEPLKVVIAARVANL